MNGYVGSKLVDEDSEVRGRIVLGQTFDDVSRNGVLLERAVDNALMQLGRSGRAKAPRAEVLERDGKTLVQMRFEKCDLEAADLRELCSMSVRAIAGLNRSCSLMRQHNAVTGFSEDSQALMDARMMSFFPMANPDGQLQSLCRVVSVLGLPEVDDAIVDGSLDVERFLAVTSTPECREFRAFLRNAPSMSDDDVSAMAQAIRGRLGLKVRSGKGKGLRMMATAAIGAANPIAGGAASLLDAFILERLLPTNGVVSFVNNLYPSCFRPLRASA